MLACMPAARVRAVEHSDEVASAVLEQNFHLSNAQHNYDAMAPHSQVSFKRRANWAGLFRSRALLYDLFDASGGCLLRQISFVKQLSSFLVAGKMKIST